MATTGENVDSKTYENADSLLKALAMEGFTFDPNTLIGDNAAAAPAQARALRRSLAVNCDGKNDGKAMGDSWILFAEAGGILVIMLLLVWWTMRGKK